MTDHADLRARIEAQVAARRAGASAATPPASEDENLGADTDRRSTASPPSLEPARPWLRDEPRSNGSRPRPLPAQPGLAPRRPWLADDAGPDQRPEPVPDFRDPSSDLRRRLEPVRPWQRGPASDDLLQTAQDPARPPRPRPPGAEDLGRAERDDGAAEQERAAERERMRSFALRHAAADARFASQSPTVAGPVRDTPTDQYVIDGTDRPGAADSDAWERSDDARPSLNGAPTQEPPEYPPEDGDGGIGQRRRRAAKWLFAKRPDPGGDTPAAPGEPIDIADEPGLDVDLADDELFEPPMPAPTPEPMPAPTPEPIPAPTPEPMPAPGPIPAPGPWDPGATAARPRPRPRPGAPAVTPPAEPPPPPAVTPPAEPPSPSAASAPAEPVPRPRPRPRPIGDHAAEALAAPAAATPSPPVPAGQSQNPDLSRFLEASEPQPGDNERDPKPARAGVGASLARWRRTLLRLLIVAFVVAGAVFGLRQYVVEPYYIPSASMEPTLHGCSGCNDDRVLVDKISYRLHDPRQKDIVVFDRPQRVTVAEDVLIKRVIGVSGDKVALKNGLVYLNGARLDEPYVRIECGRRPSTPHGNRSSWTVPGGDLFVMGDNRCNSIDSRDFGPIGQSSVVGRAWLVIWPLDRLGSL